MNQLKFEELISDEAEYINHDLGENGEVVLSVHFQSILYFWNGHTQQTRSAINKCYQRYMGLWGENITWGFDPLKDWKQKAIDKLPTFETALSALADPDHLISWYVADKSDKDDSIDIANSYAFSVNTSPAWEIQECSILFFRVPRSLYFNAESKQQILDFNLYCIEQLKPWYAVSGMQAAASYDGQNSKIDLVSQARDFKGIYFEEAFDAVQFKYGVRGFDWLTYINNTFAERIGGSQVLAKTLNDSKLKYTQLQDGFLIQASEHPEVIPNGTPDPIGYLKLNNIIRPMRDGNYNSLGDATYAGENFQSFDDKVTDLWIRRFDHSRVWNDLNSTVKSRKPTDHISLKSAEICQFSGRYRYENEYDFVRNQPVSFETPSSREGDYRSYITLNRGDIAPYYLKLDQYGNLVETLEVEWTIFEEFNY